MTRYPPTRHRVRGFDASTTTVGAPGGRSLIGCVGQVGGSAVGRFGVWFPPYHPGQVDPLVTGLVTGCDGYDGLVGNSLYEKQPDYSGVMPSPPSPLCLATRHPSPHSCPADFQKHPSIVVDGTHQEWSVGQRGPRHVRRRHRAAETSGVPGCHRDFRRSGRATVCGTESCVWCGTRMVLHRSNMCSRPSGHTTCHAVPLTTCSTEAR
jgi:hypothetical protein